MDDQRSPYLQIADMLRNAINGGTFQPGDQLPSVNELASSYDVAKMTVQKALGMLRDEGLLVSWQGRGTFVRARGDVPEPESTDSFGAIMDRLDQMSDDIQRLDERLARLESGQQPQATQLDG